jgi:hypothetical protein
VDETYYVGLRVVLLARWRPVTLPSAHAHVPLSSNTPYFPRSTSPEVGAAHRERGIRHVDDDTLPTQNRGGFNPSRPWRHTLQRLVADEIRQPLNEGLVDFQVEWRLRKLLAIAYEHAALTNQRYGGAHGVLI